MTAPPSPRSIREEISIPFEQIILRLLSKKPADRFPDAATTYVALQRARDASHPPLPVKQKARPAGPLEVEVNYAGLPRRLRGRELSRGGVFLCTEASPPPLFTRIEVAVPTPRGELRLTGEVVRHVNAADAVRWGREMGFVVQFPLLETPQMEALVGAQKVDRHEPG
jgi:hypothetical protein